MIVTFGSLAATGTVAGATPSTCTVSPLCTTSGFFFVIDDGSTPRTVTLQPPVTPTAWAMPAVTTTTNPDIARMANAVGTVFGRNLRRRRRLLARRTGSFA